MAVIIPNNMEIGGRYPNLKDFCIPIKVKTPIPIASKKRKSFLFLTTLCLKKTVIEAAKIITNKYKIFFVQKTG